MINLELSDEIVDELVAAALRGGEPLGDEFVGDLKYGMRETLDEMGRLPGFEDDHITGIKIVLRDLLAWADKFELSKDEHRQIQIAMDYMDDIDPLVSAA